MVVAEEHDISIWLDFKLFWDHSWPLGGDSVGIELAWNLPLKPLHCLCGNTLGPCLKQYDGVTVETRTICIVAVPYIMANMLTSACACEYNTLNAFLHSV